MNMEVIFYEAINGNRPALDFLLKLNYKMRVKAVGVIKLLEEKGYRLREPFSKKVDRHIFESRIKQGSNIVRIMYFFIENDKACLTNGFIKKSEKTPVEEIIKANRYRDDYLRRRKDENKRS